MKRLIRHYAVETFALYIASLTASGMIFDNGIKTMLIAGAGLTIATTFGKPVINLLLLPLNLITFNLFRWVASAVALYLVELVIDGYRVETFVFTGFASKWLDIPAITLNGIWSYIGFSFILSIVSGIIYWIVK